MRLTGQTVGALLWFIDPFDYAQKIGWQSSIDHPEQLDFAIDELRYQDNSEDDWE